MKIKYIFFIIALLPFTGCLTSVSSLVDNFVAADAPLTEADVSRGLKEALSRGAEYAVADLSKTDGYYGDPLLRLLLPPEADIIIDNIDKLPGGEKLMKDLILSINRSAEEAASQAFPIFREAITDMTISEAFEILKGADDAATVYFRDKTYAKLVSLYEPQLDDALSRDLIGSLSANQAWYNIQDLNNKAANTLTGKLAGFKVVEIDLSLYLTERALDGVFLKVAEEEKAIRENPLKRVSDILKRVFGTLD